MAAAAHVLLLTADDARRQAWTAMLAGCCQICDSHNEQAGATADVVVSDQPRSAVEAAIDAGEIGWIAIGKEQSADVWLSAGHSPRELQLACLLLTEIVRLRRQRESFRRNEKALSQLALTDPLTGLPNRRAWDEHFAERISGAGEGRPYCLALFDIDHFKRLNDERGHVAGDAGLKSVAVRLASAVRRGDFVARLGGDEFAALLADIESAQAGEVVERIRQAAGLSAADDRPGVTFSAGWTSLPVQPMDAGSAAAALDQADRWLRQAKQSGRNRTLGG